MTWTKLGDEFSDEARDLSDAAYRTHVDALCWSNRRQLDLVIPKRDLRRFGETDDLDTAVKNLVAAGWWQDCGDTWFIGMRFADWQQESVVVTRRREQSAMTTRRSRMHKAGDHSLCLAKHCTPLAGDASQDASRDLSPGSGRDGSVRDSSKSNSGAAPTPEGLGGRGAGEGVWGERNPPTPSSAPATKTATTTTPAVPVAEPAQHTASARPPSRPPAYGRKHCAPCRPVPSICCPCPAAGALPTPRPATTTNRRRDT